MKILFLACAYNRPKILKLSLMGLNRLKEIHDFDVLIACSDSESVEVCKDFGVNYFEYKNLPLGVKKNELFKLGLEGNYDYYIEFADDDLMTNRLFLEYLELMDLEVDYFKPQGLYFYDVKTKRALEFNPKNTFGAFRGFSKRLLENVGKTYAVTFRQNVNQFKEGKTYEIKKPLYDYLLRVGVISLKYESFEIWDNDINFGLDFSSEARIIEQGYEPIGVNLGSPQVIDVKSEQNIWKFEKYWTGSKDVQKSKIMALLSENEVSYLESL